jgi:hypothetical protein
VVVRVHHQVLELLELPIQAEAEVAEHMLQQVKVLAVQVL